MITSQISKSWSFALGLHGFVLCGQHRACITRARENWRPFCTSHSRSSWRCHINPVPTREYCKNLLGGRSALSGRSLSVRACPSHLDAFFLRSDLFPPSSMIPCHIVAVFPCLQSPVGELVFFPCFDASPLSSLQRVCAPACLCDIRSHIESSVSSEFFSLFC